MKALVFSLLAMGGAAAGVASFLDQRSNAAQPPQRLAAAQQQPARAADRGMVVLEADRRGHYQANLLINGVTVASLVDTGASVVAMSAEDAKRANIRPSEGARTARFSTANGVITATIVTIPEVRLQGVTIRNVEASIMPPGAMNGTLLGMSFLKKVSSFEIRGNTLVLRE
jgi:aspartyl protease family protein